jgi:hypothetical protein
LADLTGEHSAPAKGKAGGGLLDKLPFLKDLAGKFTKKKSDSADDDFEDEDDEFLGQDTGSMTAAGFDDDEDLGTQVLDDLDDLDELDDGDIEEYEATTVGVVDKIKNALPFGGGGSAASADDGGVDKKKKMIIYAVVAGALALVLFSEDEEPTLEAPQVTKQKKIKKKRPPKKKQVKQVDPPKPVEQVAKKEAPPKVVEPVPEPPKPVEVVKEDPPPAPKVVEQPPVDTMDSTDTIDTTVMDDNSASEAIDDFIEDENEDVASDDSDSEDGDSGMDAVGMDDGVMDNDTGMTGDIDSIIQFDDSSDDLSSAVLQGIENKIRIEKATTNKLLVEPVPPPNYESFGRGLVYNCTGKHWACVDKDSYKTCQGNNQWNKQQSKPAECHAYEVYISEDDCVRKQVNQIDNVAPTDFCQM